MAKKVKIRRWLDRKKEKEGKSCFGIRVFLEDSRPFAKFFRTALLREEWFAGWKQDLEDGFAEVVSVRGKVSTQKRNLSWAIEQYLHEGEEVGWRPATYQTRKERLGKLLQVLGDVGLRTIERRDVIGFIETAGTNVKRKGLCSDAVTFLNWCGNEDQGRAWVQPYKFSKLSWTRLNEDERKVGILEPEDARLLMEGVLPKYRAGMALSLFAGIRPKGELSKLQWEHVQFKRKRIVIEASVSKTRTRRVLTDLPDNLWAWLEEFQGSEGKVIHSYSGFEQHRNRVCKKQEVIYPSDGARHSFASYGYWRGEEWCRRTMGHTDTTDVFHRVYVDAGPSEEEAKEYFGIYPVEEGEVAA